jgi:hypothetical protein
MEGDLTEFQAEKFSQVQLYLQRFFPVSCWAVIVPKFTNVTLVILPVRPEIIPSHSFVEMFLRYTMDPRPSMKDVEGVRDPPVFRG